MLKSYFEENHSMYIVMSKFANEEIHCRFMLMETRLEYKAGRGEVETSLAGSYEDTTSFRWL